MPDPIIADQNQTTPPPTFPDTPDIVPMPVMDTPPLDVPPMVVNSSSPKRKKGRIIATILGILLLVGAVGAGVILVSQKQLFQQKAACMDPCRYDSECADDEYCDVPIPPACSVCRLKPGCNETCNATIGCQSPLQCYGGANLCRNPSCITETDCDCSAPPPPPPPAVECDGPCNTSTCSQQGLCPDIGSCIDFPPGTHRYCCKSCPATPTPTPPPSCTRVTGTRREWGDTLTITDGDIDKCKTACPNGKVWISKYRCDDINLPVGCQDNGTVLTWDAPVGYSASVGTLTCGSVQIDAGCMNPSNTYGSVAYLTKNAATACASATPTQTPPPGATPTPTPRVTPTPTPTPPPAVCSAVNAYDTNWNLLTSAQLSALTAGTSVRFTVSGIPVDQIDKARFTINGVLKPETTAKKPGTDEYYVEYTIPAGVSSFTVTAQIHHLTLGWF